MPLRALNPIFGWGVSWRNRLYDWHVIPAKTLSVPVISIGNITTGGTGKTSFTIWLMRELQCRGVSVGVVSRGYGGTVSGVSQVPVNGNPHVYGDEPCLIADENLGPVYVGADRVIAGQMLLKQHNVQCILADDAFQHRRLKRDLDVVLLDFSAPVSHWNLLPQGRMRESWSALQRADVIVKTKQNFSLGDGQLIDQHIPSEKLILEMDYELRGFRDADRKEIAYGEEPCLLVSGVAQPFGVKLLAERKCQLKEHMIFQDHHDYRTKDVKAILNQMRVQGADKILTTPKDGVKLKHFAELKSRLLIMDVEYVVRGPVDEFFKTFVR